MSDVDALVLAPPRRGEPVVAGLGLGERARRVAARAGIAPARVHVVRTPDELAVAAPRLGARGLVIVDARAQVVAPELVEPLRPAEPGGRAAVDAAGAPAGAVRLDAEAVPGALAALAAGAPLAAVAAGLAPVAVGPRARHPAGTRAALRAARAWQWQLVHKPLDAPLTRRVWRPLARPLTAVALRLPVSPNAISVAGIAVAIAAGVIAASPDPRVHALGMALVVVASLLDNVDGEVARLRLETSRLGGWLDTIGDDVARLALIGGVFAHVAAIRPGWPVGWLAAVTVTAAVLAAALLYWWCAVVGRTPNNQAYAAELGAAPHLGGPRSRRRRIADLAAQAARRDLLDLGAPLLAALAMSEVTVIGLVAGHVLGAAVIARHHLRIVRGRRAAEAPA